MIDFRNLRLQTDIVGVIDELINIIYQMKEYEPIVIKEMTKVENRQKAIADGIKYLIDVDYFGDDHFYITFNSDYSKFRKIYIYDFETA